MKQGIETPSALKRTVKDMLKDVDKNMLKAIWKAIQSNSRGNFKRMLQWKFDQLFKEMWKCSVREVLIEIEEDMFTKNMSKDI